MNKSTITKTDIQMILNDDWLLMDDCEGLKNGDVVKMLARMALAAMDSEPVAYMWDSKRNDIDAPGFYFPEHLFFAESNVKQWGGEVIPLYRHAQPAPVVSADLLHTAASAIEDLLTTKDRAGAGVWFDLPGELRRAAMLQAQSSDDGEPTDDERIMAIEGIIPPISAGNSPAIPDGYVMVPKEPTRDILDEFDSIIDYGAEDSEDAWRRLLAAAPQEVGDA